MRNNNWIDRLPQGISAISICSSNEGDLAEHWFKNDWNSYYQQILYNNNSEEVCNPSVFNLDIDDISPFWFENHENDCYDKSLELFKENKKKQSNAYFNHIYISGKDKEFVDVLHALDYEEAYDLCEFIDWRIKYDDTIYIHCAVGASRSQGVVRYIVDTYGDEYDIRLNPDNPNNTYNPHVVMMLKRAYRELFYNNAPDSYFQTEPIKFRNDIKLNLI
jgi:hypothetical protein